MIPSVVLALSLAAGSTASDSAEPPVTVAEIAGVWAGTLSHAGETEPMALELEPGSDGKVLIRMSVPVAHLDRAPIGRVSPQIQGNEVRLGPFVLQYDRGAKTLSGVAPRDLVPLYEIPLTLRRVERFDMPARPPIGAPAVTPVWTFDAGSPLWAGATFADETVYAGGQDGQLHAVDAHTGRKRWSFKAGGPIRTRPTVAGADAVLPGRRRVPVQARHGERGRALAGPGGGETDRAAAVRQPEVAVRPVRVGRDGGRGAALPRHARRARGGHRSGARREGLGVRLGRQCPRGAGGGGRPPRLRLLRRLRLRPRGGDRQARVEARHAGAGGVDAGPRG